MPSGRNEQAVDRARLVSGWVFPHLAVYSRNVPQNGRHAHSVLPCARNESRCSTMQVPFFKYTSCLIADDRWPYDRAVMHQEHRHTVQCPSIDTPPKSRLGC